MFKEISSKRKIINEKIDEHKIPNNKIDEIKNGANFINENNHLVTYDEDLMNNMDIFYQSIGLNE